MNKQHKEKYNISALVPTYEAKIYLGLKAGYYGETSPTSEVEQICQRYVDKVGLAVTVQKLNFIYTDGNEKGIVVGLINYPRFPSSNVEVNEHAFELANQLVKALDQYRCSVVTTDNTFLITNPEKR